MATQLYQLYQKAKQSLTAICSYLQQKIKKLWERTEPTRARITQTGIALYTSFSAFKSTIEMVPLIVSGLTIVATAPLLSYFLPTFLFDTTVMILILGTISGLVGFHKYHELKLRNELDKQITDQGKEIIKLNGQLENVVNNLDELKKRVDSLPNVQSGFYSLRKTPARQQRMIPTEQPANDLNHLKQRRPKAS